MSFKLDMADLPKILEWLEEDIDEARRNLAHRKKFLSKEDTTISHVPQILGNIVELEHFLEVAAGFMVIADEEKEQFIKNKLDSVMRGSGGFNSTCLMENTLNHYKRKGLYKFLRLFI